MRLTSNEFNMVSETEQCVVSLWIVAIVFQKMPRMKIYNCTADDTPCKEKLH